MRKKSYDEILSTCIASCISNGYEFAGFHEFKNTNSSFYVRCAKHGIGKPKHMSNMNRSCLCRECWLDSESKPSSEIIKTFVGFEPGTIFRKIPRSRNWSVICPICAQDEYAQAGVGQKEFIAHASSLQKECKPCRCAKNYRWTREEREYQVRKLCHADGIDFVRFTRQEGRILNGDSIEFNCSEHVAFYAKLNDFLHDDNRCPSCAIPGFKPALPGAVYVLLSDDGALMKIGISNNPFHRIYDLRSKTPFSFTRAAEFLMLGSKAKEIEGEAHQAFSSAGLTGFDGATEWFRYDPDIFSFIEKRAL
ncbi:hypothetical protein D9M71_345130 [compost metagenome]